LLMAAMVAIGGQCAVQCAAGMNCATAPDSSAGHGSHCPHHRPAVCGHPDALAAGLGIAPYTPPAMHIVAAVTIPPQAMRGPVRRSFLCHPVDTGPPSLADAFSETVLRI
jgi:hypothetical protein